MSVSMTATGEGARARGAAARRAGLIVGCYAGIAALWIAVSDPLLAIVTGIPEDLVPWSIAKGIGFVLVTAGLLHLLLVRAFKAKDASLAAMEVATARLRESEERFRLLARATNDAIWDWNLRTDELWWNEGFETLFGFRRDEVESSIKSWTNRIHADDVERIKSEIRQAIDGTADTWTGEYRFLRKDGTYADVLDRGYVIRDGAGKGYRMVGGMTDLTEHRKLEAQFLRAQRLESIGTLAGGIAHDLNNLLAPIVLGVDVLREIDLRPESQPILSNIEQSAKRGAELVRQVLSFARGAEGSRMPVDLRQLLGDFESMVRTTFPKDIEFSWSAADDLHLVSADLTQLNQILLNLCVNSRDAMPDGGKINVSLSNITLRANQVHGREPGDYVLIEVSDTGCGMAPKVVDRVFEPFFTTKEPGKGTGLGLPTAFGIVRSHGGWIHVYSEPGRGSVFKVYLPALAGASLVASQAPASALPRGNGELVLLVDDETSILSITRQTLEAFGYRVLVAEDGAQAVGIYAQNRDQVAVVLTDMMMPVMDGVALIQALRRLDREVRLIAASGIHANGNVERASALGVRHFLSKPYTVDRLLGVLREALAGTARISDQSAPPG